jgi:uncharacterized alkaline shock family protein YloU
MENLRPRQPAGSLKISKDVIATIAKTATMEVGGVAALPELDASRLLSRSFGRPVRVTLSDDFADIDVQVVLENGVKIPDVCAAIQSGVKDNVQTMTGIAVSKVNVTVAGVAFSEDVQ